MSIESLNRTSEILETPSQHVEAPKRVNVDVLKKQKAISSDTLIKEKIHSSKKVNINILKQRLFEEKKKEKVKRTILLSSVVALIGTLTLLTY